MSLPPATRFSVAVPRAERLDRFLADQLRLSRTAAARLIAEGAVLLDDRPARPSAAPERGAVISVTFPARAPREFAPADIPLAIVYEDDELAVVDKPAGLVVHPAPGHWDDTLVNALAARGLKLGGGAAGRHGIVHRLDKDTSGLMLVAKTDAAQVALQEAIKIRAVDRRYLTLVHGWIAPDTGLIDAPLGRDSRERMKMAVSDAASAKQSVTTFRVLERFEAGRFDDGFTLLECKLYTGRTHQIRVHMAYINHPCVGDRVYGQRRIKADLGLERQFLHSYCLELDHPITGEPMKFLDPPPEDLASRLVQIAPNSAGRTEAGKEVLGLLERGGES